MQLTGEWVGQGLLHQGALSFRLWFGQEPPLEAMRAALTWE